MGKVILTMKKYLSSFKSRFKSVVNTEWRSLLLLPLFFVGSFFVSSLSAATLNVYTYSSFTSDWGPGPKLKQAFENQCNCEVKYISSDDGVRLLNRLRLEGKNTQADVVVGLDDALIEEARNLELVQPHGLTLASLKLKPELNWQAADFVPFDLGYFAFVYDRQKTQPVTSMAELLSSDARIIYQDPRTSTPGQGLLIWMQAIYGDNQGKNNSSEAWQKMRQRTVTVTKGWSEAYNLFLQGEADYVLSYSSSPAYHLIAEKSDRYAAALFSEGHARQVEVAAIGQHSNQVALGQQFLTFLLSEEAQKIIAVNNWMLPARDGVELPEAFSQLIQPKAIGFTPEEIHQQRQAWIREWRSAVSR